MRPATHLASDVFLRRLLMRTSTSGGASTALSNTSSSGDGGVSGACVVGGDGVVPEEGGSEGDPGRVRSERSKRVMVALWPTHVSTQ